SVGGKNREGARSLQTGCPHLATPTASKPNQFPDNFPLFIFLLSIFLHDQSPLCDLCDLCVRKKSASYRGKNFLPQCNPKSKIKNVLGRLGTAWDGLWDGLNLEITQCFQAL